MAVGEMTGPDALTQALGATCGWPASERGNVPIRECGEPLRPLSDISDLVDVELAAPARAAWLEGRELRARARVVDMLAALAKTVAPAYRLVVVDAYRSVDYQRGRFELVLGQTRLRHPAASEHDLRAQVDRLVAIPDSDPRRPPPHSTGGAIDMKLVTAGSCEIDYGSRISHFDDPVENARHPTNATGLAPHQREARVRLVTAAVHVGFTNYPGEWWHFMFGDQEHALATDAEFAIYGRADLVAGSDVGCAT
jgi:D-alanyl-D-alanine dipeptidase